MPATAGRVRMPANNRVHSSAALQTHGIWQSAIGYDPYAPNKEDKKDPSVQSSHVDPNAENTYASFQGLLALARITGSNADVDRGACKKCGRVGHLKFQCKNYVKIKDENEKKDPEAIRLQSLVALDKLKGSAGKMDKRNKYESSEDSEEEEEEDSDSLDSEVDSEIERIIAKRSGRKISRKGGSSRKKRDSDEDGSDTDSDKRKNRGRSKRRRGKRETSDSDDSEERRSKRRREHRRKRDKSPDKDDERKQRKRKSRKEKRRRRSGRPDSDSDFESSEDSGRRHKPKSRRAASSSDTDSGGSDDNRISRDLKRAEKSRRHHHKDDR